mmetsp:Transcript_19566/g.43584  ORF Transcript_19566/g.43584 Transcript_19566/m.43584 type:complete len:107 (+) Transcript_19566:123-443(+)
MSISSLFLDLLESEMAIAGGTMKASVPWATPPTRLATTPNPPTWDSPKHAATAPLVIAALCKSTESSPLSPFDPNSAFSSICRPLEKTTGNVKTKSTHKNNLRADR